MPRAIVAVERGGDAAATLVVVAGLQSLAPALAPLLGATLLDLGGVGFVFGALAIMAVGV